MQQKAISRRVIFAVVFTFFACVLGMFTSVEENPAVNASTNLPAAPIYIEPKPGAQVVAPHTTIAIRYGMALSKLAQSVAHFRVTGSKSGEHSGNTVLADDQQTLIFSPDQPFQLNEVVNVAFDAGQAVTNGVIFHFTTGMSDPATYAASNLGVSLADEMSAAPVSLSAILPDASTRAKGALTAAEAYHTIPMDFPPITSTTPASGVDNGYLFLSSFQPLGCVSRPYLLILDNTGEPVFQRAFPPCVWTIDFTRQPNGLLTYWDSGTAIFHALDNTYTEVDTFQTGHGYPTDVHELQILPNNHALLMSYDTEIISNTNGIVPNGHVTATVTGLIVQELDATKNVVFEWRSWDHFQVTDTTDIYLQTNPVDYVHGNAIALDTDGNLLLSSRHLNEITKINRQTGAIIWRLGGKHNQFTFIGDNRPFSHQHDIRRLPNGNITLFDNGNLASTSYSRAVEYKLNETKKTATLVHEYRNTPDTSGLAMGSNQRLPNQDTLVGWGLSSVPALTEFHLDGTKLLELALAPPNMSYRAFRFGWQGYPTTEPSLVVVTETLPTLYYSWNGATEIVGYRVYGGTTAEPDHLIDTSFKTSFETKTSLDAALTQFCYFRVMPIDKQGHETRYSNTVFIHSSACQPTPTSIPTEIPTPFETPLPTVTSVPDTSIPNTSAPRIFLPLIER